MVYDAPFFRSVVSRCSSSKRNRPGKENSMEPSWASHFNFSFRLPWNHASILSTAAAAQSVVAGHTLISGTAYAIYRSQPPEAQEAIMSELVTAKFSRGALTVRNQACALESRMLGYTDCNVPDQQKATGLLGNCFPPNARVLELQGRFASLGTFPPF